MLLLYLSSVLLLSKQGRNQLFLSLHCFSVALLLITGQTGSGIYEVLISAEPLHRPRLAFLRRSVIMLAAPLSLAVSFLLARLRPSLSSTGLNSFLIALVILRSVRQLSCATLNHFIINLPV